MQISQTWLRSLISPEWKINPADLENIFASIGIEVEARFPSVPFHGPVVIAQVEHIEELAEFKKPIRYCRVNIGQAAPVGIVCGARNFTVGDIVVAALPGAVLPGDFVISARETYGKISEGMLCAASELGLAAEKNAKLDSGIIIVHDNTVPLGTSLADAWGLNAVEDIFELDITPDRSDLLSARGLARDLAAKYAYPFHDPALAQIPEDDTQPHGVLADVAVLTISPETRVTRFVLKKVIDADPHAKTPWWMRIRLSQAGIRAINLATDITNYVMLELGQPLHAYDGAKVGNFWNISLASPGQAFTTLDGKERTLTDGDVIISDENQILGLAGVMGGQSTEISVTTTTVIFEAAIWDPVLSYRTSRKHKLLSEAAKRFARGIDPQLPFIAVNRACALYAEYSGGTIAEQLTDQIPQGMKALPQIELPWNLPAKVVGMDYSSQEITASLESLGCSIESVPDHALVTIPSWRPDLLQPIDLVHEIIRLRGLDDLPTALPLVSPSHGYTPQQQLYRAIIHHMAAMGSIEVTDSLFMAPEVLNEWNLAVDDVRNKGVMVLNPLDNSRNMLATTLLPGLLSTAQRNTTRGNKNFSIFTQAQVAFAQSGTMPRPAIRQKPTADMQKAITAALPAQPQYLAAVYIGERELASIYGPAVYYDYTDAIAAVRQICDLAKVHPQLEQVEYPPFHPGRCARFLVDGTVLGHAGQIHPQIAKNYHLPEKTAIFEINLDALPLRKHIPQCPQVSIFPPILQDLAVVVEATVSEQELRAALETGAGELLESIWLYDIFSGDQLGQGKKSYTYALRFRSSDRTLTEDEASTARDNAVAEAHHRYGAVIRGPEFHESMKRSS